MRRAPIRIRTFLLGTVLVLLLLPTLAGGAGWLIEHDHQRASIHKRLNAAAGYLIAHRTDMQAKASIQGYARLLARLDLLSQLVIAGPSEKQVLYVSPTLEQVNQAKQAKGPPGRDNDRRLIQAGTPKSPATFVTDLYYRPASGTTPVLVALLSGVTVFLAGLALVVWLAGRWMVAPLARLSAQVDKVAGGDLTIAVPHSRIGEIANIAQAVDGLTAALTETAQRRAEADEARRFLVTSVAHDLRTPLFALRGHLQAIGTRLGNPGRPPRTRRGESGRARATDRQPLRLHARRLRRAGAPARSDPGRRSHRRGDSRSRTRSSHARQHVRPERRQDARRHRRPRSRQARTHERPRQRSPLQPRQALRFTSPGRRWTNQPLRSPSKTTGRESTRAFSRTSSSPASAERRQPTAPTTGPGSASRSRNASSSTNMPRSPPTTEPDGGAAIKLILQRSDVDR